RSVCAVQGEPGARMVEVCIQPTGRVVALLASRGECRLHVIRIGRAVEISLMALYAGRGSRQVIGSGRAERGVVALGALQRSVCAVQGETGRRMVEGCAGPVGRAVALLASSGES